VGDTTASDAPGAGSHVSALLGKVTFRAEVLSRGQMCDEWSLDTSGTGHVGFHMIGGGNREAFTRLSECSALRLFGVTFRIARDRARAEDVPQDAFVTIWERAGVFSPQRSSAMTWMTTIVHNRSLGRVCSSRREPLADEYDDGVSRLDREASPCRSPEDAQVFADSSRHVRDALQTLPGHYREALMPA